MIELRFELFSSVQLYFLIMNELFDPGNKKNDIVVLSASTVVSLRFSSKQTTSPTTT